MSTRDRISGLSRNVEEVLLLLLRDQDDLRDRLGREVAERDRQTSDLRDRLEATSADLADRLRKEREERAAEAGELRAGLDEQKERGASELGELRQRLDEEARTREDEDKRLEEVFSRENAAHQRSLDDVNDWIRRENEQRRREAEALQQRMEREKAELRSYIDKDNKDMKEKLGREEEDRRRKEEEMKDKLMEQEAARENEIIELYKKMAAENSKREDEIEQLRAKFEREKQDLKSRMDAEKAELRERLEKENQDLRDQLASDKNSLQGSLDEDRHSSNKRLADLTSKLARVGRESEAGLRELGGRMSREGRRLREAVARPMSVYFNAYRTEDYVDGGEDYLTFQDCYSNLGKAMNPTSGVFTAPLAGAYLFIIHVCTHDMNKALMALRRNGHEVASFYDQNHESNHKNSMAGQSVLLELSAGDRVQVYMYTHTGLQDRASNRLTQFVGMFLRPAHYPAELEELEEEEAGPVVNGHVA